MISNSLFVILKDYLGEGEGEERLSLLLSFSQVFCDFGKGFIVSDSDGESPVCVLVSSITKVRRGWR